MVQDSSVEKLSANWGSEPSQNPSKIKNTIRDGGSTASIKGFLSSQFL